MILPFGGGAMAKTCSSELRERIIEAVEMGASPQEAAELYEVSASSAIKWVQRWRETGSAAAKPRGGSVSPLDKFATQILAVIAEQRTLVDRCGCCASGGFVPAAARSGVFSIDTTFTLPHRGASSLSRVG